jgi:hypothetical protein
LKSLFVCFVLALLSAAALPAAATLDFYVIDVEGGKAMIVTNPSGQAMLIDGGMPGIGGRDLKRVEAAPPSTPVCLSRCSWTTARFFRPRRWAG